MRQLEVEWHMPQCPMAADVTGRGPLHAERPPHVHGHWSDWWTEMEMLCLGVNVLTRRHYYFVRRLLENDVAFGFSSGLYTENI